MKLLINSILSRTLLSCILNYRAGLHSGSALNSYLGNARIESRLGCWLPWLYSIEMVLQFVPNHNRFLSNPYQFVIPLSSYHSAPLWRVDPLLGNDLETNNEAIFPARQQILNKYTQPLLGNVFTNKHIPKEMIGAQQWTIFSTQSAPKCYNPDKFRS
jgi:hypothetical protein